MIESAEEKSAHPPAEKAAAVVRQIASAFRQVEEFESFVQGLEAAIGKAEFFDRAALNLLPRTQEEGAESHLEFPAAALCLPLTGRDRPHGMATFSNERHKFGPADLHLMAGLADLVSVLADHALQLGEQRRNLALLGFLLNQMPVGVVCFDPVRRILVSNSLGRRFLRVNEAAGEEWSLPEDWQEKVRRAGPSGDFHRRVGDQLLHVQVKATSSASGDQVTALVLADLTPEQEKFHQGMARETYRCSWLARPVSLAIIEAGSPSGLMALLRPLRERLGAAAVIGPCDSNAIGIVLPETIFPQAMEHLRVIRSQLLDDWEVGVATSNDTHGSPEALFAAAAAAKHRVGTFLKHRLLLHDDYPSVNDMLEMVLRDDFSVVKSGDYLATMRHLRTGCFDGFFSEIDLGSGGDVLELARAARQGNPKVRPFFTSCSAMARREDPLFRKETIFQKPFDVREVVGTVKEAFR